MVNEQKKKNLFQRNLTLQEKIRPNAIPLSQFLVVFSEDNIEKEHNIDKILGTGWTYLVK